MPAPVAQVLVRATFVVLWASGFIVARFVVPYSEPMTFLSLRFGGTALVLLGLILAVRAPWPRTGRAWFDTILTGLLLQGGYMAGIFWAVAHGLPAGISALIATAQPLLTAFVATTLLGERVHVRSALGIAAGFLGIVLVLAPKLSGTEAYAPTSLVVCILAVLSITAGTIWQKRTAAAGDLRTAAFLHFAASFLLVLTLAAFLEEGRVDPVPAFWLGLAWSIFGLSLGAMALLLFMIRSGGIVGVTSILFLVPPATLLMSSALFGETMSGLQIAGMTVAATGVALASRP